MKEQNTKDTEQVENKTQDQLQTELPSEEILTGSEGSKDLLTDDHDQDAWAKLQAEVASQKDAYLRLNADFENYRKRMAKERLELIQNASAEVIKSLLEVLDDSERSLAMMEKTEDIAQIKDGVKLVFHKLKQTLHSQGLSVIDAKGTEFDTDLHEAITNIAAGDDMQNKVVEVIQNGYFLNDKLLRHAKVVVGQ